VESQQNIIKVLQKQISEQASCEPRTPERQPRKSSCESLSNLDSASKDQYIWKLEQELGELQNQLASLQQAHLGEIQSVLRERDQQMTRDLNLIMELELRQEQQPSVHRLRFDVCLQELKNVFLKKKYYQDTDVFMHQIIQNMFKHVCHIQTTIQSALDIKIKLNLDLLSEDSDFDETLKILLKFIQSMIGPFFFTPNFRQADPGQSRGQSGQAPAATQRRPLQDLRAGLLPRRSFLHSESYEKRLSTVLEASSQMNDYQFSNCLQDEEELQRLKDQVQTLTAEIQRLTAELQKYSCLQAGSSLTLVQLDNKAEIDHVKSMFIALITNLGNKYLIYPRTKETEDLLTILCSILNCSAKEKNLLFELLANIKIKKNSNFAALFK